MQSTAKDSQKHSDSDIGLCDRSSVHNDCALHLREAETSRNGISQYTKGGIETGRHRIQTLRKEAAAFNNHCSNHLYACNSQCVSMDVFCTQKSTSRRVEPLCLPSPELKQDPTEGLMKIPMMTSSIRTPFCSPTTDTKYRLNATK